MSKVLDLANDLTSFESKYNSGTGAFDSVITDTISESTIGSGVTIDGLKIKDTGIQVGGLERVNIDSSGRVTTPYQPHIFGTPGLGTIGANGKADRFSVLTSRGNLTASSGVITVPVDGVYAITFTTITEYLVNVRKDNWIYVNNVVIASGLNDDNTTGFKHRSLAISMFIPEGDSIEFGSSSWYATGNSFDNWQTASVTLLG